MPTICSGAVDEANRNESANVTLERRVGRGSYCARVCCFFFSSRRRHTRLQGDWSSDVCSSDLGLADQVPHRALSPRHLPRADAAGDRPGASLSAPAQQVAQPRGPAAAAEEPDRKSTRLNSSHLVISYAVFCLKKKNHNTSLSLS